MKEIKIGAIMNLPETEKEKTRHDYLGYIVYRMESLYGKKKFSSGEIEGYTNHVGDEHFTNKYEWWE